MRSPVSVWVFQRITSMSKSNDINLLMIIDIHVVNKQSLLRIHEYQ